MVGWRHRLNGHEFEQALGVGDGRGGLMCCSPRGHKDSDTTERPNCLSTPLVEAAGGRQAGLQLPQEGLLEEPWVGLLEAPFPSEFFT